MLLVPRSQFIHIRIAFFHPPIFLPLVPHKNSGLDRTTLLIASYLSAKQHLHPRERLRVRLLSHTTLPRTPRPTADIHLQRRVPTSRGTRGRNQLRERDPPHGSRAAGRRGRSDRVPPAAVPAAVAVGATAGLCRGARTATAARGRVGGEGLEARGAVQAGGCRRLLLDQHLHRHRAASFLGGGDSGEQRTARC